MGGGVAEDGLGGERSGGGVVGREELGGTGFEGARAVGGEMDVHAGDGEEGVVRVDAAETSVAAFVGAVEFVGEGRDGLLVIGTGGFVLGGWVMGLVPGEIFLLGDGPLLVHT